MNRKQMLLALAAALLPLNVAHAQNRPSAGRPPGGPARPAAPPAAPTVEGLQAQVTELLRRVQALEATQANVVGFSRVGDDLVLEPAKGDVLFKLHEGSIRLDSPKDVLVRAGKNIWLRAASTLELKASSIKQN